MALTYRQNEIIDYLKAKKYAKISELSKALHVSDATMRRELAELKRLGLLERNHGGAVILEPSNDVSITVRQERDTQDKRETATIALHNLPNFKTVFFDNSSTVYYLAQLLDLRHKTVVTNGLVLATELCKRSDVNVIMPGGNLKTNALIGSYTLRGISEMHFNLMLCSCAAINEEGSMENSIEQSELKKLAMRRSTNKVLLVDKTKFKLEATYRTAELFEYNAIFTNADDETINTYKSLKNVNIFNK